MALAIWTEYTIIRMSTKKITSEDYIGYEQDEDQNPHEELSRTITED